MKLITALSLLALALTASSAHAKSLEFTYACNSYRYVNNNEVPTKAPGVLSYTFVKVASINKNREEGGKKWLTTYGIRVALENGSETYFQLESSGSGDEGYNSYHLINENPYWISSGSIYNNGSGASFEGQDANGGNVFFECRK